MEHLESIIQEESKEVVPVQRHLQQKGWWDDDCKRKIEERNHWRNIGFQTSREEGNGTRYEEET